jgi:hypothetical protein
VGSQSNASTHYPAVAWATTSSLLLNPNYMKWKPREGEIYYAIVNNCYGLLLVVDLQAGSFAESKWHPMGAFKTYKEAQLALNKIKKILKSN